MPSELPETSPNNLPRENETAPAWLPADAVEFSWSKRSTFCDVALVAGVAISSVSRALSNQPHVSEESHARVETAARELGYRPNYVAHSLRRGKTLPIPT
jgi:hypothetical protein